MKTSVYIRKITCTAMSAALLCICSLITIPGPVPFTMQTFALFASLFLLGGKSTLVSLTIYLFLGIVGLPVFSGMKSGFSVILGPTGGYLVGFYLIVLAYMAFGECFDSKARLTASCVSGMVLCYTAGTLWYALVFGKFSPDAVFSILAACVFPFILPDAAKIFLAYFISVKVKKKIRILNRGQL